MPSGRVFIQRHNLHESKSAQGAHIGAHIAVNTDMAVEIGDVREGLATNRADISAYTIMDGRHVALEFVPFVETLIADLHLRLSVLKSFEAKVHFIAFAKCEFQIIRKKLRQWKFYKVG